MHAGEGQEGILGFLKQVVGYGSAVVFAALMAVALLLAVPADTEAATFGDLPSYGEEQTSSNAIVGLTDVGEGSETRLVTSTGNFTLPRGDASTDVAMTATDARVATSTPSTIINTEMTANGQDAAVNVMWSSTFSAAVLLLMLVALYVLVVVPSQRRTIFAGASVFARRSGGAASAALALPVATLGALALVMIAGARVVTGRKR